MTSWKLFKLSKIIIGGFLSILLSTLGVSLLGNLLSGKGIVRADSENKKRKAIVRAGYGNKTDF